MNKINISLLEQGEFEKIKKDFTFETSGGGKLTSASNVIPMGNYGESESEFIVVKDADRFIYVVNMSGQSIIIDSGVKIPSDELPSFFKKAFLSKSLEDAETIHVLGNVNTKEKYPVKTGLLQIVAIEAKDLSGRVCLYPMDSTSNIYSLYRDDGFKATKQQEQQIRDLKTTILTKSEYLELVISMDAYEKKTSNKNISFDDPSF